MPNPYSNELHSGSPNVVVSRRSPRINFHKTSYEFFQADVRAKAQRSRRKDIAEMRRLGPDPRANTLGESPVRKSRARIVYYSNFVEPNINPERQGRGDNQATAQRLLLRLIRDQTPRERRGRCISIF